MQIAPVDAVIGLTKVRTESGESTSDFCTLDSPTNIPGRSIVIVVRKFPCRSRYGETKRDFLQVLFAGKTRLVSEDAVFLTQDQAKRFAALEPAQIEASSEDWRLTSLAARKSGSQVRPTAVHTVLPPISERSAVGVG